MSEVTIIVTDDEGNKTTYAGGTFSNTTSVLLVEYSPMACVADLEGVAKALNAARVPFVFVPESLKAKACSENEIADLRKALDHLASQGWAAAPAAA